MSGGASRAPRVNFDRVRSGSVLLVEALPGEFVMVQLDVYLASTNEVLVTGLPQRPNAQPLSDPAAWEGRTFLAPAAACRPFGA